MSFEELKAMIEREPNKKYANHPLAFSLDDIFIIQSILYFNHIYCGAIQSIDELYDVVSRQDLDPNLFNKPYYVIASFDSYENFTQNTIDIINQLDDNIYVQINIREEIDKDKFDLFFRIKHNRCIFNFMTWINLDDVIALADKYTIDKDTNPVLIIKEVDSATMDKIKHICKVIDNPRFRFEISDAKSLENFNNIISSIKDQEIIVILDNEIFNENNPNNGRYLLTQKRNELDYSNNNISIQYNGLCYETVEQIYELERNMELIKSHVSSDASELDKITYVTLFVINYFKYDYDMLEKSVSSDLEGDINLTQFISRKKGVCRHFADFTKYILNSMGIECERVDAFQDYMSNGDSDGHAFNIVRIGDKKYFLDNTWIAGNIQSGTIHSLAESSDFLKSNEEFCHDEYHAELDGYHCETYNREEINNSVNRVLSWKQNYVIHMQALKDLFRRHLLKREKSVAERIEDAIPRRGL